MNSIEALVRPNIRTLSPYSTARDEAKGTPDIFLDANESPYPGLGYNRYPDPRQKVLKARVSALQGAFLLPLCPEGVPERRQLPAGESGQGR